MNKERNDLTLKILALFLAIFMWTYVMNSENPETSTEKKINLEYINKESLERDGLVMMNPKKEKITIEISGKRKDIDRFSSESINAYIDLKGYTEGDAKVPVKVSLERQMDSIKIIDYQPKTIDVTFDKLITKDKKVTIRPVGELKESYVLGNLFTKSEIVLLKGPRTWIEEISEVVAFVDLEGMTKDTKVRAPLRLLDAQGNDVEGIEKEPSSIDINVPIMRTKNLKIDLKTNRELPEDYEMKQLVLNPSSVSVKGNDDIMAMTSIPTKEINVDDLISKKEIVIELDLPEGVQLLEDKKEIKVSLNMVQLESKSLIYNLEKLNIKNLDEELELATDLNGEIELIIRGDINRLENISIDNVKLFINGQGLKEGIHDVSIESESSEDFSVQSIEPKTIKIELKKKET